MVNVDFLIEFILIKKVCKREAVPLILAIRKWRSNWILPLL